jgi:prepilin peptidase CpaA
MTMIADVARLMLFPAMMAFAASSDLLTMTISNRVSIILVGSFFALALASGMSAGDMLSHAGAAGIVLVVAFGCFARGWIGGGDAKLFAATCLWLGPAAVFTYSIYVTLIGFGLTLLVLLWRGLPLPGLLSSQSWLVRLHNPREGVPYGIALSAAGLLVYPATPFVAALGS